MRMNKRSLYKITIGVCLLICLAWYASGQSAMNWPEDTIKAKEQYAFLEDSYNSQQYHQVEAPLNWLLTHAPDLHENIYIFGINTFKKLIDTEPEYFEKLLQLYRDRIKYYGNAEQLNLKMLRDAYRYGTRSGVPSDKLLLMFDSVYAKYGHSFSDKLLVAYMDIASKSDLEATELIDRYIKINKQFETLIIQSKAPETTEIKQNQGITNQILLNRSRLNCEAIQHKVIPKLKETSDNADIYKTLLQLAFHFECTDREWFTDVLERVYTQNPTYNSATYLANKAFKAKQNNKAEKYYLEAIELAEDKDDQVKACLNLSSFYSNTGNKIKAREYIKKALQLQPGNKEAYQLWGNLYYSSYEECKQGKSRVQDRLVYLAAYEKYQKAGDSKMMQASASQFPSMEDIHQEDYRKGQEVMCYCWINEKVILRKRVE